MFTRVRFALTTALLLLVGARAVAAQTITLSNANAGTLTVTTATAGLNPNAVSTSTTTFRLRTVAGAGITRVMAAVNTALPAGVTLSITLATPGGTIISPGAVALTTTPQAVLTGLPNTNTNWPIRAITYTLTATAAAGTLPVTARTVTFSFQ